MGHSLTYRLPDFNWTAAYRVIVRGIGPRSIEAVQVDLTGTLRIANESAANFPKARISVYGVDSAFLPPRKPFGLLALNPDTPLTDLWLGPPPATLPLPSYYLSPPKPGFRLRPGGNPVCA